MHADASTVVPEANFSLRNTNRPGSIPAPIPFTQGLGGSGADTVAIVETAISGPPSDRNFGLLCSAFRARGGTARGDDLARLLEDRKCGDFVTLARLIVSNDVFAFEWRNTLWVPMFQFELRDLSVRQGPRSVLAELWRVFDGWALAAWFARPNSRLNHRSPVDTLDSNLAAVLEAARADRFVSHG